jgi:high-affinity iron transporter
MIASLVLSLREGVEAALIIGIVFGAVRKAGRTSLYRPIWAGVISAGLLSLMVALALRAVDMELEGRAEQIFEGLTLALAAGVLTWMVFWMRRHAVGMQAQLESNVSKATQFESSWALFFLAFIAVLREGIELALYLTAAALTSTGMQTLVGTTIGLATAFLLGYLIYSATVHLNLQRFFQVTAVFLILFAAGLVAQSVAEFNEAGVIPAIISPLWNLNPVLSDQSVVGTILSTLFGYHGNPSLTEVLGYSVYIVFAGYVLVRARRPQKESFTPPVSPTFPSQLDNGNSPADPIGPPVGENIPVVHGVRRR